MRTTVRKGRVTYYNPNRGLGRLMMDDIEYNFSYLWYHSRPRKDPGVGELVEIILNHDE